MKPLPMAAVIPFVQPTVRYLSTITWIPELIFSNLLMGIAANGMFLSVVINREVSWSIGFSQSLHSRLQSPVSIFQMDTVRLKKLRTRDNQSRQLFDVELTITCRL